METFGQFDSFSLIHSLAYSFIGIQTAYLSTFFPSIFWNAAVLRVESGLEDNANSDYKKIAKAVCDITSKGIEVHPIDINKSMYAFEPDAETNSIIYGMKALNGVNGDSINQIIENRPYNSFADFTEKCKLNKTVVLSLIKSGAFDKFNERRATMDEYLASISGIKSKVTMQNLPALINYNLVPAAYKFQKSLFNFNKSLKGRKYLLDDRHYSFYSKHFEVDDLVVKDDVFAVDEKKWKKLYDKGMEPLKDYIKTNQNEVLDALNNAIMTEAYNDNASGNYSSWEMESMGFYYHSHEMFPIDASLYNVVKYNSLPETAIVEKTFKDIPIYKLSTIMGTVIAKDDVKSSVSLLTVESGVVTVKFNREVYADYNRRISEVRPDGTKKFIEDSWFAKGSMLMIMGVRRNDVFFAKRYKSTPGELVYKVTKVNDNGTCERTSVRYGEEQ